MNELFTQAGLLEVLEQLADGADYTGWRVRRISRGGQAELFLIRAGDGQPIVAPHCELIVKLYKHYTTSDELAAAVRDEFTALSQLGGLLNGQVFDGWRLHVPLPIRQLETPRALVMTRVPGTSLGSHQRRSAAFDSHLLDSAGRAAISALRRFWSSSGRPYGDLNLQNILCDLAGRSISLVDCGLPEQSWQCDGVSRRWYPASRDLAYLLFSAAVNVKSTLLQPGLRTRQVRLVERMIEDFLKQVDGTNSARDLLSEIEACTLSHLETILLDRSPAGLWRRYVKRAAGRKMAESLERLRTGGSAIQPAAAAATPRKVVA